MAVTAANVPDILQLAKLRQRWILPHPDERDPSFVRKLIPLQSCSSRS
jgi:predicted nucleic acid-binding Zn ribbon protein